MLDLQPPSSDAREMRVQGWLWLREEQLERPLERPGGPERAAARRRARSGREFPWMRCIAIYNLGRSRSPLKTVEENRNRDPPSVREWWFMMG